MELILREEPDIDILFAHNDDMALGAIEIPEEHGVVPGVDIIIGFPVGSLFGVMTLGVSMMQIKIKRHEPDYNLLITSSGDL